MHLQYSAPYHRPKQEKKSICIDPPEGMNLTELPSGTAEIFVLYLCFAVFPVNHRYANRSLSWARNQVTGVALVSVNLLTGLNIDFISLGYSHGRRRWREASVAREISSGCTAIDPIQNHVNIHTSNRNPRALSMHLWNKPHLIIWYYKSTNRDGILFGVTQPHDRMAPSWFVPCFSPVTHHKDFVWCVSKYFVPQISFQKSLLQSLKAGLLAWAC